MIKREYDRSSETISNMRGGPGKVIKAPLATPAELMGKVKMYSLLTLEPGCGIGVHEHMDEVEIFYVAEGEADYNDNGTVRRIFPGDVTVCHSGESHGVTCAGSSAAKIVAMIVCE